MSGSVDVRAAKVAVLEELIAGHTGHWVDRAKAKISALQFRAPAPAYGFDSGGEPRRVVCGQCGNLTTEDPCQHCQIGNPEGWKRPVDSAQPAAAAPENCSYPDCERRIPCGEMSAGAALRSEPAAPVEMPEAVKAAWAELKSAAILSRRDGWYDAATNQDKAADELKSFWRDHSRTVGITEELENVLMFSSLRARIFKDSHQGDSVALGERMIAAIAAVRERYGKA